jgi:hypothetical protein
MPSAGEGSVELDLGVSLTECLGLIEAGVKVFGDIDWNEQRAGNY